MTETASMICSSQKVLDRRAECVASEASHQSLHRDVMQILNQTHHAARELFNLMFEKGWYTLQAEQPSHCAAAAEVHRLRKPVCCTAPLPALGFAAVPHGSCSPVEAS